MRGPQTIWTDIGSRQLTCAAESQRNLIGLSRRRRKRQASPISTKIGKMAVLACFRKFPKMTISVQAILVCANKKQHSERASLTVVIVHRPDHQETRSTREYLFSLGGTNRFSHVGGSRTAPTSRGAIQLTCMRSEYMDIEGGESKRSEAINARVFVQHWWDEPLLTLGRFANRPYEPGRDTVESAYGSHQL